MPAAGSGGLFGSAPHNDFGCLTILAQDQVSGLQVLSPAGAWLDVPVVPGAFVVNVGDTIQGRDDKTAVDQWKELRPIWARYQHYPLYFTPGNHDVWSSYSREVFEKESRGKSHYSFDYEDAHFVVLDTAIPKEVTKEQLDFLKKDLEENKDADPKFIVFHHPEWIGKLEIEAPGGYYLTWSENRALSPAAETLKEWLIETAASTQTPGG